MTVGGLTGPWKWDEIHKKKTKNKQHQKCFALEIKGQGTIYPLKHCMVILTAMVHCKEKTWHADKAKERKQQQPFNKSKKKIDYGFIYKPVALELT